MTTSTWTVKGYVNGEQTVERTIETYEDLVAIKMCGILRAPTWRSGGVKRDEAGTLVAIRQVAGHKRQALELIAERV